MNILLYIFTTYIVINIGITTFFMSLIMEEQTLLFPYLIKNLRYRYNLNWGGVVIVLVLLAILTLPAFILTYILSALLFICRLAARKFCKIFERKDL